MLTVRRSNQRYKRSGIGNHYPYSPFEYKEKKFDTGQYRVKTCARCSCRFYANRKNIRHEDLKSIGYTYDTITDKWNIGDAAADYLYTGNKAVDFALPGTLKVICDYS